MAFNNKTCAAAAAGPQVRGTVASRWGEWTVDVVRRGTNGTLFATMHNFWSGNGALK
jgi:hypothetical protein